MINQLQIIHSKHGQDLEVPKDFTEWKTCLRSIYFGNQSTSVTHSGVEAYELLLQIICGLHSPMIGETEILSQFKTFIDLNPNLITHKISHKLIQDAKSLRTTYLKGYGSQSYGSYTLKKSKDKDQIVILGAGSLAQEILPIIRDFEGEIIVKTRSPLKSVELSRKFPQVRIESLELNQEFNNALMVVAAPLPTDTLEAIVKQQLNSSLILDMRSTTDGPRLTNTGCSSYQTLTEIFSEIEKTQKVLALAAAKMKSEIKERSLRWHKQTQVRPFGWEDLCC